ncbi:MAG: hypothetical protein A2268_11735 [Candidatus Raymondbacteria bacterium RifOxyA12_full_50_37]|uniref:Secretion system C-terminal sorting domain-containing protein n=1 Tax=Candidatus Raymondbacteria bacterium RIFOXYD12_FULL_49_13 TaxID=1817890 RepID=A0A1F7FJD8_UNCRA|nr:MAG: hypothetical protein A2248_18950 [Candidatus Raymondbacteria bacterium RIFOXYA2_FULL_49_16]OGJ91827.1 MAG: hypothetical protein A2268_11735 [Candidatus Raymondbacteria bacterium RifOxyA12_full_50_37]OGJ92693.1 MAG: hypothetical protein A2350_04040 [Candidatus Raymondbacteria bacterium RifOxyB12_full_50_8]OGJ95421.1 MAG: hypothetical protein A2453_09170 [Candidatus Raymondbacteria bacterium RIFOXYC2_FULL_50_21]OGJ97851.1 MAG: hypothetical protein A2487_17670 [Candidatus Raymondbacteria b
MPKGTGQLNLPKLAIAIILSFWALLFGAVEFPAVKNPKVPYIDISDNYYPPWDWDDVLDIEQVYTLTDSFLDPKLFVCDQPYTGRGDGRIWRYIFGHIYGRDYYYAMGLINQLGSVMDNGLNQPAVNQEGVNKILEVLGRATGKIRISNHGSYRDIAAAFLRDSNLVRQKVERIYMCDGIEGDIHNRPDWGSDAYAVKILLENKLPCYITINAKDSTTYSKAGWSLDLPAYLAMTDTMPDSMHSAVVYWAYYNSMDNGYRTKHNIPFPDRPSVPDGITEEKVQANGSVFFSEPRDQMSISGISVEQEIRSPGMVRGLLTTPTLFHAADLNVFIGNGKITVDYRDSIPGLIKIYDFLPHRAVFTSEFNLQYIPCTEEEATIRLFKLKVARQVYSNTMNAVCREFVRRFGRNAGGSSKETVPAQKGIEDIGLNVFPNPFNAAVSILFNLRAQEYVQLTIYDANGRLIEKIQGQWLSAGNHVHSWSHPQWPSGIYVITVKAENKMYTKRTVLMQ